jgi:uncharacterized protein YndB with AHSA1/START domain
MSAHGPSVDAVVVQAFFDAIRPAQLDALAAILATQQTERQRLTQQWEERLKRARYEVHLADRQYQAVDPDNRLVAAELERRWEEKLRQLQEMQESYEQFCRSQPVQELAPELGERFRQISNTLPELWPDLSRVQQKELLRSLISYVVLTKQDPDRLEVKIVWISGHYSVVYAWQPAVHQQDVSGYDDMLRRLEVLWRQGLADDQIAAQLTAEGFHTARKTGVAPSSVVRLRHEHGWLSKSGRAGRLQPVSGCLVVRELAARLEVELDWIYRRIYDGTIDCLHVSRHPEAGIYLIEDNPQLIERLRQLLVQRSTA